MFVYKQSTGEFSHSTQGKLATGYAGGNLGQNPEGINQPDLECVRNVGPLPKGKYTIQAPQESHGGFALPLVPDPSNEMYGRSGFMIHGGAKDGTKTVSQGCICLPRTVRWMIWGSGDRELTVVA